MAVDVFTLVSIIQAVKCTARIKIKSRLTISSWSWVIIPTAGYIELGSVGPWPISEVDWLEINPIVMEHMGRLVAPRIIDNLPQLETALQRAELPYIISEDVIRVSLSEGYSL